MRLKNKIRAFIFFVCLFSAAAVKGYEFDANDFAAEVVSYEAGEGAGIYIFSEAALGRPSVDTDYYGAMRPIVPVYPQWLASEIVRVAVGGHLILKFNHRVSDDENNPHGIDFIVFGNAMQAIGFGTMWEYGDPCAVFLGEGEINCEYAKVSVSQDGMEWYSFEDGLFGDCFAPTLGRIFDTNEPYDVYPGWENLWWGEVTVPTLPLDPNLSGSDFAGVSVAQMCAAYGKSAGGTGFDLRWLADFEQLDVNGDGQQWIQYIKIECLESDPEGMLPEIDAVSDVGCCGDYKRPYPLGDISKDCKVDCDDLEILAGYWLWEVDGQGDKAEATDLYKNGVIDFLDFAVLGKNWFVEGGN